MTNDFPQRRVVARLDVVPTFEAACLPGADFTAQQLAFNKQETGALASVAYRATADAAHQLIGRDVMLWIRIMFVAIVYSPIAVRLVEVSLAKSVTCGRQCSAA